MSDHKNALYNIHYRAVPLTKSKFLLVPTLGLFLSVLFFAGFSISCTANSNHPEISGLILSPDDNWVGTWSTAPQLVEPHNMPPAPGLSSNTLRQFVRVSIGGDSLRVRFSNEFSTKPVTMKTVQIAVSKGIGIIDASTIKTLKFEGKQDITMAPGTVITSDPVAFHLLNRMDVAITIYFESTSPDVTGHPGSRTTSFLYTGNKTSVADTTGSVATEHWYVINGIDVKAVENSSAVAILGNSITDGRGSGINKQNRWPDILSERLLKNPHTKNVGVLNMGIGGNCVLRNCLGPAGVNRFDRDILKQHNVKWIIILEGINDLGQTPNAEIAMRVADRLIEAYKQMIEKAHSLNIKVYGATILPFGKSFYYADYRMPAWNKVNDWIRNSGNFDAVIDFARIMQSPENSQVILSNTHSGDFLHPNENGYKIMGEAIDLKLFE